VDGCEGVFQHAYHEQQHRDTRARPRVATRLAPLFKLRAGHNWQVSGPSRFDVSVEAADGGVYVCRGIARVAGDYKLTPMLPGAQRLAGTPLKVGARMSGDGRRGGEEGRRAESVRVHLPKVYTGDVHLPRVYTGDVHLPSVYTGAEANSACLSSGALVHPLLQVRVRGASVRCEMDGEGLEFAVQEQPATFTVRLLDATGAPVPTPPLIGPGQQQPPPCAVTCSLGGVDEGAASVRWQGGGAFVVEYTCRHAGLLTLDVAIDGDDSIHPGREVHTLVYDELWNCDEL
jgi:hypothetical protein